MLRYSGENKVLHERERKGRGKDEKDSIIIEMIIINRLITLNGSLFFFFFPSHNSCSGVNWYLAHSDDTVSFVWFKALFGIVDFLKVVSPLFLEA